jgi:hypothetical protein
MLASGSSRAEGEIGRRARDVTQGRVDHIRLSGANFFLLSPEGLQYGILHSSADSTQIAFGHTFLHVGKVP